MGNEVRCDGDWTGEVREDDLWDEFPVSGVHERRVEERTYLDVEGRSHSERNEDKEDFIPGPFDALDDESEPAPEEGDTDKLGEAEVEEGRSSRGPFVEHERVRVGKEVETSETHDDVVQIMSGAVAVSMEVLEG